MNPALGQFDQRHLPPAGDLFASTMQCYPRPTDSLGGTVIRHLIHALSFLVLLPTTLAANFRFYSFFKPRPGPPEKPQKNRQSVDFGTEDGYQFFLDLGPLWDGAERVFRSEERPSSITLYVE